MMRKRLLGQPSSLESTAQTASSASRRKRGVGKTAGGHQNNSGPGSALPASQKKKANSKSKKKRIRTIKTKTKGEILMKQMTTNQALVCYGLGGLTAICLQ